MKRRTERRKFPRKKISLPLTYLLTEEPFKKSVQIRAMTKNISQGGLAFISGNQPNTLTVGLNIQLSSKKKSKKGIKTKARIVWSKPVSTKDKNIFATGVCFLQLSKKDYSLLNKELAKMSKKK